MSDTTDKIVSFPGKEELPTNPITIEKDRRYSFCSHEEVSLDDHLRVVHCRKCGAVLDPFQFLMKNAQLLQNAWSSHAIVINKIKELNEKIDTLQREQKRLQGRVKTLQKKEKESGVVFNVRKREEP